MKIVSIVTYSFVIIVLLFFIILMNLPNIYGYLFGYNKTKKILQLNKNVVIIDPINKKQIGYFNKGTIFLSPSMDDAIDLGTSLTKKIVFDLDEDLLEEIKNENYYDSVDIK